MTLLLFFLFPVCGGREKPRLRSMWKAAGIGGTVVEEGKAEFGRKTEKREVGWTE